ncbi:anti-sigma factor family protein [Magnetococcales bacterium HHB-1]
MQCNPELVSAFLDGELANLEMRDIAEHLMACDRCCHTLAQLAQVRDALAENFSFFDPEAMTAQIMTAIDAEPTIQVESGERPLFQRLIQFGVPSVVVDFILYGLGDVLLEAEKMLLNQSEYDFNPAMA